MATARAERSHTRGTLWHLAAQARDQTGTKYTMRPVFCFLAALIAPRCAHSFAPLHYSRGTPVQIAPRRQQPCSTSSSSRAEVSMTLPGGSNLNRALGTVLVGGALLTGVVGGAGVARAELSISPRCEFGGWFAAVSPSFMCLSLRNRPLNEADM